MLLEAIIPLRVRPTTSKYVEPIKRSIDSHADEGHEKGDLHDLGFLELTLAARNTVTRSQTHSDHPVTIQTTAVPMNTVSGQPRTGLARGEI